MFCGLLSSDRVKGNFEENMPVFLNRISNPHFDTEEYPPPRFAQREVHQNLELEKAKPSNGVARGS